MKTFQFRSTGDAYDACQCGYGGIEDGDLLVIDSERVIGVAHTWPVALTVRHGELHKFNPGIVPEQQMPEHAASFAAARDLMRVRGWR